MVSPRLVTRTAHRARPRLEVLEDRTAPAVIVVQNTNDAGANSLRQAITDAVASAENDQIVFAADLQGQTITLASALPAIDGGGALSIIGPGDTRGGITLDGDNAVRPFNFTNPAGDVSLLNLTLTQGFSGAGNSAGALLNANDNVILTEVEISRSRADQDGGGIQNLATGSLILNRVSVTNNQAINDDGGAIQNLGTLVANGSRITSNRASSAGGGIDTRGAGSTTTLTDTTVSANGADFGAGLEVINGGTLVVNSSLLAQNQASLAGGGVRVGTTGTATVTNTTVADNASLGDDGGGGFSQEAGAGTLIVVNSTITGNVDDSGNADGAGGIANDGGAPLNVYNTIIAENFADVGFDQVQIADLDANLTNTIGGDPRLGPLQDNGGPTLTRAPLPNVDGVVSPILNTGTNANATSDGTAAGTPLASDQRGFPRIIGGTVDRGAVERFGSSTTVMLEITRRGASGMLGPLPMMDGMATTSTARSVTLEATVMGSTGAPLPTGSVDFFNDADGDPTTPATLLNSTPIDLDAMGTATLPNAPLPAGSAGLFARFNPSSGAFSSSASPNQTVAARVVDTVGVYDPNGVYQTLNLNTTTTTGPDFGYSYGILGDQPVVGNWTGAASGVNLPGVVGSVGGFLRWTLGDENPPVLPNLPSFDFGNVGQTALAGDWDGDGTTGIGIYDPASGTFALRNTPGAGPADFTFTFGGQAFVPVVGNWDGAGGDEVGLYNPATGQWLLLAENTNGTSPPLFTPPFNFGGQANGRPVAGDWDGDGTDGIGLFFPQSGANANFGGFLLRQTPSAGDPDVNGGNVILAGLATWLPVAGNWGVAPTTSNPLLGLSAAEGIGRGGQGITAAQWQSVVDGAFRRLASAGAGAEVLNVLIDTRFVLADLPGATLGLADPGNGVVLLDIDAAGHGWFVDTTPEEDSEFAFGPVAGMDLLSAVWHEMGHLAGHGHNGEGLMAETLSAGVRHTEDLDALFGTGLGHDGPDHEEVGLP